jgi:hypothetical protein
MSRFLLIAVCTFAVAAAGCKKKEEAKPAPAAAGSSQPVPAAPEGSAAAPAPGAPAAPKAEYKPDEIFKDTAGKSRMDLMETFKDGATVTGAVKEVKDDPAGEYVLVFDAGDGHVVEANLADPKPARDKKVKAGDTVTVTKCQVANPTDTSLPLRTCDLK